MRNALALAGFLFVLLYAAGSTAAPVNLRLVADGLSRPVAIAHAGDPSRLFVVEQEGRIRIVDASGLRPTPFLDISAEVACCGERGLLGLAFHPDYASNGWFFVNYTNNSGNTVVARYTVSPDPDVANPASAVAILAIAQPFANHNGGQLAFDPAGKLLIGVGDGGSGGDPQNNAQNRQSLLGKILRLDVDGALPYGIPVDNPFRFDASARDEIWAFGLRNPWRFSFDRVTGDLFIADVGQSNWEEINVEPASSPGGVNYGWRRMEGAHCYNPSSGCDDGSLTLPVLEYSHAEGCSVTGGYRYRGSEMPKHEGTYFFGDYCSGRIWGGRVDDGGAWARTELLASGLSISTFGEDASGELYVADLNGAVYRLHGETFCSVILDQASYTSGQTVNATRWEVANLSSAPLAVETKVWLEGPGFEPISISTQGADGSLELPAGYDLDAGPFALFDVTPSIPVGEYRLGCRFLDPTTGDVLAEDVTLFSVQ